MPGFSREDRERVVLWQGEPDSQAAHDAVLLWLGRKFSVFHAERPTGRNVNIVKGNLGEAVALMLGDLDDYGSHHAFTANAHNPFQLKSDPDIDIVWVLFGPSPTEDVAILQEVKATGNADLSYANALLADYEKLFGVDPKLTLRTRLDALKVVAEYEWRRPELCPRITALAGNAIATSPKIRLLPTLVHESKGADPHTKMTVIRSRLVTRGWSDDCVSAWAIGFEDLDDRILRLAMGQG